MDNNFIENIKIEQYKCFENFEVNGFKRINLIGGKNNIGKTAFMEACYLGLSTTSETKFYQALIVLELSRNPLEEFKIIEDSNSFNFKFENTNIYIKTFNPLNLFSENKNLADSTHKRIPLTKIIASIPVSSLKTS
jgi:AAA15 family ATPase/GTPase